MEFDEHFNFDLESLIDDNVTGDLEFTDFVRGVPGVEYLSNVDYSLNSPLIRDEIEEFLKYCAGNPYRKSWDTRTWSKRRQVLTSFKISGSEFIPPQRFHNWFGENNLKTTTSLARIIGLLNEAQRDSDETFPVVDAFLKGWINKTIQNPDKTRCDGRILKWGAKFLDFHIITILLNCSDDDEAKELLKIRGIKRVSKGIPDSYTYTSDNFGKVIISHGFCFFLDEKVIMDRNTVLMCKDTYIARFQTLFSMVNRVDDVFEPLDWMKVHEIYKMGDALLRTSGIRSYDAIKMIEPICSLRLSDIARGFRPLIPRFQAFADHISTARTELETDGIRINPIYNAIMDLDSPDLVLTIYGSFRHWGHPYLDYLEGLKNVHDQVTMEKKIDVEYANVLASDLAFIVLSSKFNEQKKWFVDVSLVHVNHPLYTHIKSNTWPTPKQIQDFGHHWHDLPLLPCFDIPDVIDPSLIYADKSHSMNRRDVISSVRSRPDTPIPSIKVLQTFLNKPATNWREFLKEINEEGLKRDDLVIGLKGKEREVKIKGRFFTLMSWRLREYFVVTEYLIKSYFVPLFSGLTMADDLNTVIKKLMDNSNGQGLDTYDNICIANHIDYTKWNNHQRNEGNEPVFKVMGKFLGYENLISRTHEFFQKSLIYYNGRPDLMIPIGDSLVNKGDNRVCWEGQAGGLEGLRQKGWSVVNLLVIRRESINCNTKVKILAQGDNQVICTQYKLQKSRTEREMRESIDRVIENNKNIMDSIERGTIKLGLIINKDETLQSADYLVYGKVPIFRGNIKGLETKRWSRVTCVTNDQLPTLANTLSTINSNALTVAHFQTSPLNAIVHYNFLGNFGRILLDLHNPALKMPSCKRVKYPELLTKREYKVGVLYLDPCLGGACGMSLTRFLIRNFPDPLTESLAFWKIIHHNGDPWLKQLAAKVGNPKMGRLDLASFKKLLEDPLAINIPGGVSPLTWIKEEIKAGLISKSRMIKNNIVRESLQYMESEENKLIDYLRSIKPLFPRFLSEYMSATYIGIIRNLVGLFQNSKTIRNVFTMSLDGRIKKMIIDSEVQTLESLGNLARASYPVKIWDCSASQSDKLRRMSWGTKVYGATIPHPIELMKNTVRQGEKCPDCSLNPPNSYYISTFVPSGLSRYKLGRGPYKAYLGSKTSESTSIIQPWEKETKIPLIRRAVKLRDSIGWFIDKDSNLAKGVLQNLKALTGEDWDIMTTGFERTGCPLHRYECSRQSSAGYSAQSPSKLTWMCSTTDTLSSLNSVNYDFMHQALLLYVQATVSEIMDMDPDQGFFHSHVTCLNCLREVEDIKLDTPMTFNHKDVHVSLEGWKPQASPWAQRKEVVEIQLGNWANLNPRAQSYHVGRAEGFLFGDMVLGGVQYINEGTLFPLTIQNKVIPKSYLSGILDGLIRASGIHCISRRAVAELKKPKEALLGVALYLIEKISDSPAMITLWRSENFENLFFSIPHNVPPSYPLSNRDLGSMGRGYLRLTFRDDYVVKLKHKGGYNNLWIFSDINTSSMVGLLAVSGSIVSTLYGGSLNQRSKAKIRSYKDLVIQLKDPNRSDSVGTYTRSKIFRVDSELRHACKQILIKEEFQNIPNPVWGEELSVNTYGFQMSYRSNREERPSIVYPKRVQNPLISGLRLFQFATGSHYKIRSILKNSGITYQDAIVGGDGSGGIGAFLLRSNPHSRIIFNSLLDLSDVDLRGISPSPPSAISALGRPSQRCVNFRTAWEYPSDLSSDRTWEYFLRLKAEHELSIDLIIIDAEVSDDSVAEKIESLLSGYVFRLLDARGTLIYKTYISRILSNFYTGVLGIIGSQFLTVHIVYTGITSSESSEVYVVCSKRRNRDLHIHPSLEDFTRQVLSFPAYSSVSDEFCRALSLAHLNFFQGVPSIFISDKFNDLSGILETLGVETGVSALLVEVLRSGVNRFRSNLFYTFVFVVMNSLLNLTSIYNLKPPPKSDKRVYHIGVFVCGALNWLSLATKSFVVHERVRQYINQWFLFSWKYVIVKSRKRQKSSLNPNSASTRGMHQQETRGNEEGSDSSKYRVIYSFLGKYKSTKNFHLDSKMGLIGSLQRAIGRVFGYETINPDRKPVDKYLRKFNSSLSINLIRSTTDLLSLALGAPFQSKGSPDILSPESMNADLGEVGVRS